MSPEQSVELATAAEEFNRHEGRRDGVSVAGSLNGGLSVLRDSLYLRLHDDVERMIGKDSMLLPVSELKAERATRLEIEIYQVAESAAATRLHGYLRTQDEWYPNWLARLRLAEKFDATAWERIKRYLAQTADQRRLKFGDALAHTLPESERAPLVLFHLVPLAVEIATCLAFGDHRRASEARKRQIGHLAAITDCQECHGYLLENGERCRQCGNPLWKATWLTVAD
jgi:hypothetical protein